MKTAGRAIGKTQDKKRLDLLLVERGLVSSRQRAQSLILAGKVLVDDTPKTKPGERVAETASLRIKGEEKTYVSRGGEKLSAALDTFGISVEGRTALDIGASTGGFTHVLLLRGAVRVYAVDVGHNQMDWKIRSDPKVVVLEKVNARYLEFSTIGEKVDLIVSDVSFISLDKILPALLQFSKPDSDWVTLIKPQFEAGRAGVGKKGVVTSESVRRDAVEKVTRFGESLGLKQLGLIESPIIGAQGNKEFLAHWKLKA